MYPKRPKNRPITAFKKVKRPLPDRRGLNKKHREELAARDREIECLKTDLALAKKHAGIDPLTSLLNRRGIEEALKNRGNKEGVILYVDANQFKELNDSYSHDAGDKALQKIAQTLRSHIRQNDICGRMGGDEFIAVLEGIDANAMIKRCTQLQRAMSKMTIEHNGNISFSASVGYVPIAAGCNPMDALHEAEAKMYQSKRHTDRRSPKIS